MTITLATLKDATHQQIFNQVARHLMKQGKRAVDSNGSCKYRAKDGLMCAAGCLVGDDEHPHQLDNVGSWRSVVDSGFATDAHVDFISALQNMHDTVPGKHSADASFNAGNRLCNVDDMPFDFVPRLQAFVQRYNSSSPECELVFDPDALKRVTLSTLPLATAQEVFDQVAVHLLTQGAKSVNNNGKCRYRGNGGLMCAAGCLITDSEYSPDMDTDKIGGLSWESMVDEGFVTDKHQSLIARLQILHDHSPIDMWESKLINIANKFGLNTDVITELNKGVAA